MKTILITGFGGLIGSAATEYFLNKGYAVVGVDNDGRKTYFGEAGSVSSTIERLKTLAHVEHHSIDLSNLRGANYRALEMIFKKRTIEAVIHTAAQPSHDFSYAQPLVDFKINALGTVELLELTRKHAKDATFIHFSTNKVYGDTPNYLPIIESEWRYDFQRDLIPNGITEKLTIDNSMHSVFGASKVAADIMVQEYGKYYGMNTVALRCGCLTGANHQGVELHGFLSYIIKCAIQGKPYTIYGYKGKQVRDQIDAYDVASACYEIVKSPVSGEVFNLGGGPENSASILEIINILNTKYDLKLETQYVDEPRRGDHQCYYTDLTKFKNYYPDWTITKSLNAIIHEMVQSYLV